MSGFEAWLGAFLAIAAFALLGHMQDWEIRVVDDPKDGRRVGIAIERQNAHGPNERFHAVFSPAQARQLAQWLRVAAAPPGRTLAEARLKPN